MGYDSGTISKQLHLICPNVFNFSYMGMIGDHFKTKHDLIRFCLGVRTWDQSFAFFYIIGIIAYNRGAISKDPKLICPNVLQYCFRGINGDHFETKFDLIRS